VLGVERLSVFGMMHGYHHRSIHGLSDIVPGFEDGRVSDLINPSTRTRDANLVHGLLSPEEAALVLSIPLSCTPVEDKIIWPFTPSGNYTVNSGSKFLAKLNSVFVLASNSQ